MSDPPPHPQKKNKTTVQQIFSTLTTDHLYVNILGLCEEPLELRFTW